LKNKNQAVKDSLIFILLAHQINVPCERSRQLVFVDHNPSIITRYVLWHSSMAYAGWWLCRPGKQFAS
jgi:hypothetical protein